MLSYVAHSVKFLDCWCTDFSCVCVWVSLVCRMCDCVLFCLPLLHPLYTMCAVRAQTAPKNVLLRDDCKLMLLFLPPPPPRSLACSFLFLAITPAAYFVTHKNKTENLKREKKIARKRVREKEDTNFETFMQINTMYVSIFIGLC